MCQEANRKERKQPMLRLNCIWIYVIHKVCVYACVCMHVHACADFQRAGKSRLRHVLVGFHTGEAHLRMSAAQREVRKAERSREMIAADITEHLVVLIKSKYHTLHALRQRVHSPDSVWGRCKTRIPNTLSEASSLLQDLEEPSTLIKTIPNPKPTWKKRRAGGGGAPGKTVWSLDFHPGWGQVMDLP